MHVLADRSIQPAELLWQQRRTGREQHPNGIGIAVGIRDERLFFQSCIVACAGPEMGDAMLLGHPP